MLATALRTRVLGFAKSLLAFLPSFFKKSAAAVLVVGALFLGTAVVTGIAKDGVLALQAMVKALRIKSEAEIIEAEAQVIEAEARIVQAEALESQAAADAADARVEQVQREAREGAITAIGKVNVEKSLALGRNETSKRDDGFFTSVLVVEAALTIDDLEKAIAEHVLPHTPEQNHAELSEGIFILIDYVMRHKGRTLLNMNDVKDFMDGTQKIRMEDSELRDGRVVSAISYLHSLLDQYEVQTGRKSMQRSIISKLLHASHH